MDGVKAALRKEPALLERLLKSFGFAHIVQHERYISFGRDKDSSPKSIVLFLEKNEALFVQDYARNTNLELFSYIAQEKCIDRKEVLDCARALTGETGSYARPQKLFGGMFERTKKAKGQTEINENVLSEYIKAPNLRFYRDGISTQAQNFFDLHYDPLEDAILIPIRSLDGQLIGIKARVNKEASEGSSKYYYVYPCLMSKTLYGFWQNRAYLVKMKTIYIVEAEKSVMQAYTFGVRNIVALGSSSLSQDQARAILSLCPERVVLMHDEGLIQEVVEKNLTLLSETAFMREVSLYYWMPGKDIPSKASPTDLGKGRFIRALKECKKWEKT